MSGLPLQMKKRIVTYRAFDVVVVPFPFTERQTTKRRPALVVSNYNSFGQKISHGVLAMITSVDNSPWPLDVQIDDLDSAGLPSQSKVRMKLFTLDFRLILRRAGKLCDQDKDKVTNALKQLFTLD